MTPREELDAAKGIVIRAEARFKEFYIQHGKQLDITTVTVSQGEILALKNTLAAYTVQAGQVIKLEAMVREYIKEDERRSQLSLFGANPGQAGHPRRGR